MKFRKILMTTAILLSLSFLPAFAKTDNRYGITIDGKFKDWAKYPKQTINFDYNNNNVNKEGAFLRDGDMLYLYIDMHPKQTSGMTHTYVNIQPSGHYFNLDGAIIQIFFVNVPVLPVGKSAAFEIATWGSGPNITNGILKNAKGFVTRVNENGAEHDIVEVAVPISSLINNAKNTKTVTFKTENLGQQTFTFTGTPTGSVGLILIGFGFAAFALYAIHRKQSV